MREERRRQLEQMTSDELQSLDRNYFTISELHEIVDETRLNKFERDIAELWLFRCYTDDEISEALGYDRRTINKHRHLVSAELKHTLIKLFYCGR